MRDVSQITFPMIWKRDSLKEAAVSITWGKLVAPGIELPKCTPGPVYDTPCKASDHHSYFGIPSLFTPAAPFTKFTTFSCNVSLLIRSSTLVFTSNDVSQNV